MIRSQMVTVVATFAVVQCGCATAQRGSTVKDQPAYRSRAMESLRAAVRYGHNPVVRAEAVEALEMAASRETLPWIRAALIDPHPAVRFAACVAVGRVRDTVSLRAVRICTDDNNCSVRAAAIFALHRFGDESRSGQLPSYLLGGNDITCRRNAALVLGLLDEPSAIKALARAMKDPDFGVRHHALEAMARLGNPEARHELAFLTSSGVGSDEVFAIGALSITGDRTYADTFRYKLATAAHVETRLAAARGLGTLGIPEGFDFAMETLRAEPVIRQDSNDPASEQTLRVKQMAIAALGAIRRADALPVLARVMAENRDPRVQVSAARAVLEILGANRRHSLPFATPSRQNR